VANQAEWFAQSGSLLVGRQWVANQMGVALLLATPGPPPNVNTSLRWADVSANEVPATGGYTAGGQEILSRSYSYDSSDYELTLAGNDVSWGPGATISARYGVVYEMATTDKYLWLFLDFGNLISVTTGVFTVDWISGVASIQSAGPV